MLFFSINIISGEDDIPANWWMRRLKNNATRRKY
jgi:hypothetical protein